VTTGKWESREALAAGFQEVRAAGVDFDYDDRGRDVFNLLAV
jgi:hypothetical protein